MDKVQVLVRSHSDFAGGVDELTFRGTGTLEKTDYGYRLRYTAQNELDGSAVASEVRLETQQRRAVVITESKDGGYGLLLDPRAETVPDPHEGQVYINDGFNMVWLTPQEGVPIAGMKPEDFRRDENEDGTPGQRVRYIGADYATRWGVDVSNYQGTIDWASLKAQGVEFAYLRIGLRGYGEAGTLYPDRSFVRYYEGAQAAGIDVGVYMFSQAATPLEAAEEALYVQQLLDGRELQLPVYYDWEPVLQEDSRTLDSSRLLLTAQARVFCELIEKSGYDAGVYMNRQQGYYRYDLKALSPYKLWIADYGDWPDFYYRFDVWQYAADGRLDGVSEILDLNVEFVPVG